tara:strand:+ start:2964 stop:4592 length:1629 start_codon:yes stop_codon:yes gene_type:complete
MLNHNLSKTKLIDSIGSILDDIEILKTEIEGLQLRPLKDDAKILGEIHHAINIDKYESPEFRKQLLFTADKIKLNEYFKKINLNSKTEKTSILIDKACKKEWGNNLETKAFVDTFDYPNGLIPIDSEKKTEVEDIIPLAKPFLQLYPYQYQVFDDSLKLLGGSKHTRFIIQMPTGAGKTRTAMELISHFINNGIDGEEDRQVLWLADREELSEQAIETFQRIWSHLGKRSLKLYRVWGSFEPTSFEKTSFVVAGYQKLQSMIKNKKPIPKPDLIVCDEAHNAIASGRAHTTETVSEHGCRIIGLTATPVRQVKSSENVELVEFFNEEIVTINPKDGIDNSIQYLQQNGFLSYPIRFLIDWKKAEFTITPELLKIIARSRQFPDEYLELLGSNNQRNLAIIKQMLELAKREVKVLYFGPTRKQSKTICAFLISQGYSAAYVDGSSPKSYRQDVINKFKSGEIKIVCNVDLFTAGFDEPKINAVVIARPTKSIVLYFQMAGRGMRGPKMNGTKTFELYQMNDEFGSIDLTNDAFTDYWRNFDEY